MRPLSVRRFDLLVFGWLLAVFLGVGVVATWQDRGPSREESQQGYGKENVWAWTLPDEPEPAPEVPPELQGPIWVPRDIPDRKPKTAVFTTVTRKTLLLPVFDMNMASQQAEGPNIAGNVTLWTDYSFPALDSDVILPGETSSRPLSDFLFAQQVYQPAWLMTDNYTGRGAYNPPKEMVQGETTVVTVLIAADGAFPVRDLFGRLVGPGKPEAFPAKVSRTMSVDLHGDTFIVNAVLPKVQAIGVGPTEWQFEVQPQEAGKHNLVLTILRMVPDGDQGRQPLAYPPERRSISVIINPMWTLRQFLKANWEWLASSLALPLLVWAFAKIRGRERKRKAGFGLGNPTGEGGGLASEPVVRRPLKLVFERLLIGIASMRRALFSGSRR
jgi:hypothetical protein